MKDLFVGALGKLNNHGGSRMFTTPHTINVPPEYSVETDIPSVAEFVTCSLDGRLWVYRRSRRFYVAAFRWDENTQRLVFVSTTILSNEAFVLRGVDWILTDKSLIQSIDETPYITRTTYDDSSYLDAVNKSYSLFPELETWQKIQGEQIIHIEDSPSETLQELTQSLVTPLEFHYYSENNIQAFTEFSPKLCYLNGQLYGKGKAHIGRAYLLPRTFSEDGEPEDFYLYISPDYLRTYNGSFDDNDGWDNLRIAPLNSESIAIFTPHNDDFAICKKAENAQIFTLPQCESLDLSADNGALFFDALTGSNLALNDKGASFMRDGLSLECKGIQQWLAPSGKVDAVSPQLVMSSFDNGTLATHVQGGFHRELLTSKTLPLSASEYSGKRLSLDIGEANSRKTIQVNSASRISDIELAIEEIIYKPVVKVQLLNNCFHNYEFSYEFYQVFIKADAYGMSLSQARNFATHSVDARQVPIFEDYSSRRVQVKIPQHKTQIVESAWGSVSVWGDMYWEDREYTYDENNDLFDSSYIDYDYAYVVSYTIKLVYINPQTGELLSFEVSVTPENTVVYKTVSTGVRIITSGGGVGFVPYSYQSVDEDKSNLYQYFGLEIHDSKIYLHGYGINIDQLIYVADVPDEIKSYVLNVEINSINQCKVILRDFVADDQREGNLLTRFEVFSCLDIFHTCESDIPKGSRDYYGYSYNVRTFFDWSSLIEINGHAICTRAIHVIGEETYGTNRPPNQPSQIIVFRSELHPEILDIYSEIERSKLF